MSALKASQLKPLAGFVLVEPILHDTKTASGVIIPDADKEKPQRGKVLAISPETVIDGKIVLCPVNVGEEVIYKQWGGHELEIDDVVYQFLKYEDVLAVVE